MTPEEAAAADVRIRDILPGLDRRFKAFQYHERPGTTLLEGMTTFRLGVTVVGAADPVAIWVEWNAQPAPPDRSTEDWMRRCRKIFECFSNIELLLFAPREDLLNAFRNDPVVQFPNLEDWLDWPRRFPAV
jgi:hypothetical protein